MKLHFDNNQEYQIEAIRAITDIFEGQPLSGGDFEFSLTGAGTLLSENGIGNKLSLTEEQIWNNVERIQQYNEIKSENTELQGMNFSAEMETGTGKTYVYLRTIYELNKLYGFKKFVIVVPSIAIREGVLKNLQITHEYFQTLYDKAQITYEVYDSKKVSNLRGFACNNAIQILVINIDSFAKDENIINKPNDKLTGKRPIEFLQSSNPIVIVDEPQNMETDIRKNLIPLDSSVENQFARDCESHENIEFFFKLPSLFRINTPIGTYNPDWAVVFTGEKKVYFVAETKSDGQELRPNEQMKIDCGRAHFKQFENVRFSGPISSVSELTG